MRDQKRGAPNSIGTRLGAKVGETEESTPAKTIQFSKLLGFENVTDSLLQGVDFQNETLGDKLGAKIGPVEVTSPANGIDFQDDTFGAQLGAKVGDLEAE